MGIFDSWKKYMPRPKPDFTNVRSGGTSTAAAPASEPQADGDSSPVGSADTDTYYVVAKGDTLSSIANGQYGRAHEWRRIYEANLDLIKDPDLIYPGQRLRIP
jgi:nucleoid-associated protein YgaU